MGAAAGQAPEQEAVDGAEAQLAAFGALAGLALVGDADGGDVGRAQALAGERVATDLEGGQPDFLAVVLHPAVLREVLLEFLLAARHRQALGTEHDGAGAGGALVDGEEIVGHGKPDRLKSKTNADR